MLQKKDKKCLEAENIPLTELLFYIREVLDPVIWQCKCANQLESAFYNLSIQL